MSQPKRRPPKKRSGNDSSADDSESVLGGEPHWEKVYNPGKIVVSDPSHARLIKETGNGDNGRVEFVGDAAAVDKEAGDDE